MTTDDQIRQAFMRRQPAEAKRIRHEAMREELARKAAIDALGADEDALHLFDLQGCLQAAGYVCALLLAFAWCYAILFAAGCV